MLKKRMSKKESIFIQEKEQSVSDEKSCFSQSFHGVPYLKRGDSSVYIDQFLGAKDSSNEPPSPLRLDPSQQLGVIPPPVQQDPKEESAHSLAAEEDRSQIVNLNANPSAFHNFQKHLTVALKHAVVFKNEEKMGKDYFQASCKLWRAFAKSKICTKKVLHFLLGTKNEHQITAGDLRQFGFARIYQTYGDKVISEARIFLLREVLRQIKEQNCLQKYFQNKKIKDKETFKRYVQMFVQELEAGFLRKRLPRQKVEELAKL